MHDSTANIEQRHNALSYTTFLSHISSSSISGDSIQNTTKPTKSNQITKKPDTKDTSENSSETTSLLPIIKPFHLLHKTITIK